MNKLTIGLMAAGLALGVRADVQTWNATSHVDTNWNTTSANWDDGAVWKNGNAAVFPAGGAPTAVTEEIHLSCLTNKATSNIRLQGSGKLVFEGSKPQIKGSSVENRFDCSIESANRLNISGSGVVLLYGANTLPNGVSVSDVNTQVRINTAAALGTGPLVLGTDTAFWTVSDGIEVTNKIVQSGRARGGALNAKAPIYRRIGTTDGNTSHIFGMGRASGGVSSAILSLADDSEGIGYFAIQGNFGLTVNGGTVKARTDASSPFFRQWDNETYWTRQITVGRDGFTFDSNGATKELVLGAALKFPATVEILTNDVGECASAYANPYFESGSTGWTTGTLPGNNYGVIGRTNNGGSFCNKTSHYTTNGTYFVALRCYSYAASSIAVPESGLWRLACDIGNRPDYAGWSIPVTVTVDEGTANEQSYVIPSRGGDKPFAYCATRPFALEAGSHTVKYAAGNVTTGSDMSSVHFDCFRLVKCEVITNELAAFEKKGVGTLEVEGLTTDGRVTVSGGTLRLKEPTLNGTKLQVVDGATLELQNGSMTETTLSAEAGATVRFVAANLIGNGSFETPVTSDYVGNMANTGWSQTLDQDGNYSGYQRNGGAMSKNSAATPAGDQTAFVRARGGSIYQSVTANRDGTYDLSFLQAPRLDYPQGTFSITVSIDDEPVLTLPHDKVWHTDFVRQGTMVSLTAGTHVLKFTVSGGTMSGVEMFIDDVGLFDQNSSATVVAGGRIDLESGSTIDLQNRSPLVIPEGVLFVDGQPIRGGKSALRQAGVTVTGSGRIKIGDPLGMMLLLR